MPSAPTDSPPPLLRPHQTAPLSHLLSVLTQHDSGCDFSDTGTGKTYVSAAVASFLKSPCLVVGPKIARSAWARAAAHFSDSFSFVNYDMLRTGRTPFGTWEGGAAPLKRDGFFVCENCQQKIDVDESNVRGRGYFPCYARPQGIHSLVSKRKPHRYGKFNFHPAVKLVIFDEVHRCKGLDSLNSKLLIAARRQGIKHLSLTATAGFSPLDMRALGYSLGLHNLDYPHPTIPTWSAWLSRHSCRYSPGLGWKWFVGAEKQLAAMHAMRDNLIPARGVRVTTDSIPGFPECDIAAELYDVSSPEEVNRLYQKVKEAVDLLADKSAADKCPEHPLTALLRARQRLELLKVPIAAELLEDYVEKGFSMVVFVNFTATLAELMKQCPQAEVIDGSVNQRDRDSIIGRFQSNKLRRLFVNVDAGKESMSLHDLQGGHPRGGLVMPVLSATTLRQVFGRLPRDGGKTRCFYRLLLAAETVETKIYRAVNGKLNNLDALNDGDLSV